MKVNEGKGIEDNSWCEILLTIYIVHVTMNSDTYLHEQCATEYFANLKRPHKTCTL